jgi:hypothetical protein
MNVTSMQIRPTVSRARGVEPLSGGASTTSAKRLSGVIAFAALQVRQKPQNLGEAERLTGTAIHTLTD